MHAVTSVETNVNWNGARCEYFRPQRGIRQGYPISPYLFVLCMDKLSHLIEHEVKSKNWRIFQMGKQGPVISHLMFSDDLLLFGEAMETLMNCVMKTLQTFCSMSGQEVSNEKTSILFSANVSRINMNKLLQISEFKETQNFGKYLDVPLKGRKLKATDYHYMVDKISNNLAAW